MKRYCLKPKAKETIKEGLITVFYKFPLMVLMILPAFGLLMLPLGLLMLPFVLITGQPNDAFAVIVALLGILSWTAVFSFIVINIKRWLQSNIVEC